MAVDPIPGEDLFISFTDIYMLNGNGYIEFSFTYMEVKEINTFKKNTRMNKKSHRQFIQWSGGFYTFGQYPIARPFSFTYSEGLYFFMVGAYTS